MSDRLLSRQEAARYLRIPPTSLATWAYLGRGPSYYRVGKRVVYRESELIAWLDAQRVDPGESCS